MRGYESREGENDNFRRCLSRLEDYLIKNGRTADYDALTKFFGQPNNESDYDAHIRVVTVADRDGSIAEFDEPVMYHAAFFTKQGAEKSGMLASLSEIQDDHSRQIEYEFHPDKNVRRVVTVEGAVETDEILQPDEVGYIADQLDTIGSASSN